MSLFLPLRCFCSKEQRPIFPRFFLSHSESRKIFSLVFYYRSLAPLLIFFTTSSMSAQFDNQQDSGNSSHSGSHNGGQSGQGGNSSSSNGQGGNQGGSQGGHSTESGSQGGQK